MIACVVRFRRPGETDWGLGVYVASPVHDGTEPMTIGDVAARTTGGIMDAFGRPVSAVDVEYLPAYGCLMLHTGGALGLDKISDAVDDDLRPIADGVKAFGRRLEAQAGTAGTIND
jgi:hypothetical protein